MHQLSLILHFLKNKINSLIYFFFKKLKSNRIIILITIALNILTICVALSM